MQTNSRNYRAPWPIQRAQKPDIEQGTRLQAVARSGPSLAKPVTGQQPSDRYFYAISMRHMT